MGFWHTGYLEFHEHIGIPDWAPRPVVYTCSICSAHFEARDTLDAHRLAAHPHQRPVLLIRGAEAPTRPLRITVPLRATDIAVHRSARIRVDGRSTTLKQLRELLSACSCETVRISLHNDGVDAHFQLDFRIAASGELSAVDRLVQRMVASAHLTTRAIEDFLGAARPLTSAADYVDGICAYLYGVLAKERALDSHLSYDLYPSRFSKAADTLSDYDTPLSGAITSLVHFHFNNFAAAHAAYPSARVGAVAHRFAMWIAGSPASGESLPCEALPSHDSVFTDADTERILRLGCRPLAIHTESDILDVSASVTTQLDEPKLSVLLGEFYRSQARLDAALPHARALHNLPGFEAWADRIIAEARGTG